MTKTHFERSFGCRETMLVSEHCGCYHCKKIYHPKEVIEYVKDHSGMTPVCPFCMVDSVVPFNQDLDGDLENFQTLLGAWYKESFT